MSGAEPAGWRLSFVFAQNHRPPFKLPDEHLDYQDRETAERHRDRLRAEFGDSVVASVAPIWPKPPDSTSKAAKRRSLEFLGWPVQMSPRLAATKPQRRPRKR